MKSRVGEVWELTWQGNPAEVVLVVDSRGRNGIVYSESWHTCLVLAESIAYSFALRWKEGTLHTVGDWNDANGWRRIA